MADHEEDAKQLLALCRYLKLQLLLNSTIIMEQTVPSPKFEQVTSSRGEGVTFRVSSIDLGSAFEDVKQRYQNYLTDNKANASAPHGGAARQADGIMDPGFLKGAVPRVRNRSRSGACGSAAKNFRCTHRSIQRLPKVAFCSSISWLVDCRL
jgi:hypothetical protein